MSRHRLWLSQIPQLTKSREFIRELALLAIMHGHGHGPFTMTIGWWNLEDFIQNWHRANLGSPSFTTHSLYLSCTSHSSRNLQSSWARGMTHRWKSKLAKRTKNEQSLLKITKMDAISGGKHYWRQLVIMFYWRHLVIITKAFPPNQPIEYAVSRRVRYYCRLPLT